MREKLTKNQYKNENILHTTFYLFGGYKVVVKDSFYFEILNVPTGMAVAVIIDI